MTRSRRVLIWYASLARAKAVASCRYRIGNLVEVGRGASAVIAPSLPSGALSGIDVLVIVRPYPSRAIDRALSACEARGIVRIADYDDLLFAGPPELRPEVTGGRLSADWAERAQRAYASLLPSFDAFTVATETLANELRAVQSGPVFVVPNGLAPTWVAQGRALHRGWRAGDRRIARFFPGSPTHDVSFEMIRAPLARWLAAHADAELEIIGNLSWDPTEFPRARHRAPVPFDHLPELLASAWINVWPRADSRFNRCKSPIKFLEAAAFGCPTIASPGCVSQELANEGLIAAADEAEWYSALERMTDGAERERASRACLQYAQERGSAAISWQTFERALGELGV